MSQGRLMAYIDLCLFVSAMSAMGKRQGEAMYSDCLMASIDLDRVPNIPTYAF
jgi:hypothetical protein